MFLKRLFSIILIAAILLQIGSTIAVVASFKINQDYIANYLCINRDKPELECKGKCVLMQRMQQELNDIKEHDRQKAQHIVEQEVLLFFQKFPPIAIFKSNFIFHKKLIINTFDPSFTSLLFTDAVFHPPTV
jgi:hypothetical protein